LEKILLKNVRGKRANFDRKSPFLSPQSTPEKISDEEEHKEKKGGHLIIVERKTWGSAD